MLYPADPARDSYVRSCDLLKVHFLDINKATGDETQKKFDSQHGPGQARFICCDVTSHDQLEGYYYLIIIWLALRACGDEANPAP